jgi:hypothetical protein
MFLESPKIEPYLEVFALINLFLNTYWTSEENVKSLIIQSMYV